MDKYAKQKYVTNLNHNYRKKYNKNFKFKKI